VNGFDARKRFDLVVVALNSVLLLDSRVAQRELFATIARHLAPGGRAVVDVWLPAPDDLALYDGRLVLDWLKLDDETGETVAKQTSARYDSASRVAYITSLFDAWREGETPRRTSREDRITFVSVDELSVYATDAGLQVDTIAGDYEMGHFAPVSERVVMVCRSSTG
jgi:SAM-dependent methyltransferase